jgi:hypothetical protein
MNIHVCLVRTQLQVFYSVICSYTVDMVYNLTMPKRTPKMKLHGMTMKQFQFAIDCFNKVSRRGNRGESSANRDTCFRVSGFSPSSVMKLTEAVTETGTATYSAFIDSAFYKAPALITGKLFFHANNIHRLIVLCNKKIAGMEAKNA